jgi:hypothetical protein
MKRLLSACLAVLTAPLAAAQLDGLTRTPEAFIAAAEQGLAAELGLLDGGSLTRALRRAALQGRPVRLLLDPGALETRREGVDLAALTPTVQVRWMERAGSPLRRLIGRDGKQLLWRAVAPAQRADAAHAVAIKRFEDAWAAAAEALTEEQGLEVELKRLPDPSETEPHFIRRREIGAREESHADPSDP